jgi:hypothetical protein
MIGMMRIGRSTLGTVHQRIALERRTLKRKGPGYELKREKSGDAKRGVS